MNNDHRISRTVLSGVFALAVFLFWWLAYPQALGFKEQNQLFLYTWGYLGEMLSVAGGGAGYVAAFITQFFVSPVVGALLMAILLLSLQRLVWIAGGRSKTAITYVATFIPSLIALVYLGDIHVSLSLVLAVWLSMLACVIYDACKCKICLYIAIPVMLWLVGPAAWIFIIYAACEQESLPGAIAVPVFGVVAAALIFIFLQKQFPLVQAAFGINYYDIPLRHPALQHLFVISAVLFPVASKLPAELAIDTHLASIVVFVLMCGTAFFGITRTYDKDTYEVLAYDQLIRHEKWFDVIKRAERYQPHNDVACVSINLSLYMSGQKEHMDEFWQCGTDGLLMPRVRDNISNISTGEAFWRMGLINEALRYAFDTQEAVPSKQKNPRSMMRMAECQILNGRYEVASKYLDILKHSLFYRKWAKAEEKFLGNEEAIYADPTYAYLLSARPADDYLFYYPQMDRVLRGQYERNKANVMAATYCVKWLEFSMNEDESETADDTGVHGSLPVRMYP